MNKISFRGIVISFWSLVCIDLFALLIEEQWLHTIAKPLLMPTLILVLINGTNQKTTPHRKLVITGLLFSWLGDLFLLPDSHYPLLFIAGLSSFLITHICYTIYFLSVKSAAVSLLKKQPVYFLLILGYGAGLVWLLFPHLGDLEIPVILYASVICTMLLCSLHVFLKVTSPANKYFVAGAMLFVLSDSLLAINKFYQPLAYSGTLIMLTYCAAQYFIVMGFIKRR